MKTDSFRFFIIFTFSLLMIISFSVFYHSTYLEIDSYKYESIERIQDNGEITKVTKEFMSDGKITNDEHHRLMVLNEEKKKRLHKELISSFK